MKKIILSFIIIFMNEKTTILENMIVFTPKT